MFGPGDLDDGENAVVGLAKFEFGELPTILRNVDLERIARGEGVPGDWLCSSVR